LRHLEALKVKTPQDFKNLKEKLKQITQETYKNKEIYQQFFIRTVDDHRMPVKDYTLEFFVYRYKDRYISQGEVIKKRMSNKEIEWSQKVHSYITDEFHNNLTDPSYRRFLVGSYRRFLVGLKGLRKLLKDCYKDIGDVILSTKIHIPRVDEGIYYDTKKLKNIFLLKTQQKPSLFYPNTTTLMELKVNRSTKYVSVSLTPKKH